MRHKYHLRMRLFALTFAVAAVGLLTIGAGSSLARGIHAKAYYEDPSNNLCVGLEEAGGFGGKSCEWGAQTGTEDVGVGAGVGEFGTTNSRDVSVGYQALVYDKTGNEDTALGYKACLHNTSASYNTCTGSFASLRDTTGEANVADGSGSLQFNTTGSENTGDGDGALFNLVEGSHDVAVGHAAGSAFTTTESNNVDIANEGVKGDSGITRIGTESTQTKAFIAGIYEKTITTPACGVVVNSSGQLGCKSAAADASSAESSTLAAELKQEHARSEHQQKEIEQLAAELKSLRKEVQARR